MIRRLLSEHLSTSYRVLLLGGVLLLTVGCGDGANMANVSGVVTLNGKAVPQGTITFYPSEGGRPATGTIQADGTYMLSTDEPGDGALLGEHKVAIEAKKVVGDVPPPASLQEEIASTNSGAGRSTVTWIVPEKFASAASSGLTATVGEGENKIDFSLP